LPAGLDGAAGISPERAYEGPLFHGPYYQLIDEITGMDALGIDATLDLRAVERNGLSTARVLDVAPQLAMVWSHHQFETDPLPTALACYVRLGELTTGPITVRLRVEPGAHGDGLVANAWFLREGHVLAYLEGMECAAVTARHRPAAGVLHSGS
jgi:hypothetical protein